MQSRAAVCSRMCILCQKGCLTSAVPMQINIEYTISVSTPHRHGQVPFVFVI